MCMNTTLQCTHIYILFQIWKVTRALKLKLVWRGWMLSIERGETTKNEEETANFDSQV